MHHYCTVTADTLSIRKDMGHVWRVAIPREGYQHPFVMHGILTIDAAHKAHLVPSNCKTYLALCDYHQTIGSQGFRSELHYIKKSNGLPPFSFASIVVVYMVNSPNTIGDPKTGRSDTQSA